MDAERKPTKTLKRWTCNYKQPGDEEKIYVNVVYGADCWIFAPTDTNMIKTKPILSAT